MTKLLFENLQTFLPKELIGKWDIPEIKPTKEMPLVDWIGWNYASACKDAEGKGIHFFIDDAQFIRLWNWPDKYISVLKRFRCVLSPDFSLYSDMPKALQVYNCYRKHWLAAYWQYLGIPVIPTISWSDKDSFSWCFDGEPTGGIVAVGTTGTQQNKAAKAAFLAGYREMIDRLHPSKILVYGNIPKEIESSRVVSIGNYSDRFKNGGV